MRILSRSLGRNESLPSLKYIKHSIKDRDIETRWSMRQNCDWAALDYFLRFLWGNLRAVLLVQDEAPSMWVRHIWKLLMMGFRIRWRMNQLVRVLFDWPIWSVPLACDVMICNVAKPHRQGTVAGHWAPFEETKMKRASRKSCPRSHGPEAIGTYAFYVPSSS